MTGNSSYPGIDVESPEWIGNLDASADADKLFVVAAFDEEAGDDFFSKGNDRTEKECQNI